jgi:allantoin racemase
VKPGVRLMYLVIDGKQPSEQRVARWLSGAAAVLPPGWEFGIEVLRIAPDHYYESALGKAMAVPGMLETILRRQEDYDAIVVGCFGDPGLDACREVAAIPVIGPGVASLGLARLVASRFGVVTMEAANARDVRDMVARCELGPNCVGVEAIDVPIAEIAERVDVVAEELARLGQRLVDAGAEAIVLGCLSFAFHPRAVRHIRSLGTAVIDPLRAAVAVLLAYRTCELDQLLCGRPPRSYVEPLAQHLAGLAGGQGGHRSRNQRTSRRSAGPLASAVKEIST